MKPKLLIRISTGLVLFFALGHSVGHFNRKATADPMEKQVIRAMSENKFDMFGQARSYDQTYTGMSLNLILSLLLLTGVLWFTSTQTEKQPGFCRRILIVIMLCLLGFSATGFFYFFMFPAVTCLMASSLCGLAAWRLK